MYCNRPLTQNLRLVGSAVPPPQERLSMYLSSTIFYR